MTKPRREFFGRVLVLPATYVAVVFDGALEELEAPGVEARNDTAGIDCAAVVSA